MPPPPKAPKRERIDIRGKVGQHTYVRTITQRGATSSSVSVSMSAPSAEETSGNTVQRHFTTPSSREL